MGDLQNNLLAGIALKFLGPEISLSNSFFAKEFVWLLLVMLSVVFELF